jgi:hypothetical protein
VEPRTGIPKRDDMLLDLIHDALKRWKAAELDARRNKAYLLEYRNRIRAEALRNIYLELLREARRRRLSLTDQQLLDRILYPVSDRGL